jgi:hypothetical protein
LPQTGHGLSARDAAKVSFLETSVPEPAESSGLDEFVRKAAEREGVDEATAARSASTQSRPEVVLRRYVLSAHAAAVTQTGTTFS